jgi:uncharacterized membrane protein YadS
MAGEAKNFSKFLLQASVVGLGFGMNLHQVVQAGRSGFVYTMLGISFALLAGMGLGALLGVQRVPAFLISTGTAICGGSAIAAVGPITNATDEEMAVSLGTVFVLNSVALLIFPAIGTALKLTQSQFGLWAALAIHDTSSVVGAAAKYGAEALAIATTVKLARALWIVPLSVATASCVAPRRRSSGRGSSACSAWPRCATRICRRCYTLTRDRGERCEDWIDRHFVPDRQRHLGGNDSSRWDIARSCRESYYGCWFQWDRCG